MDLTTHLEIRRIREEHTAILARAAQLEQRILALEASGGENPLPSAGEISREPATPPPLPQPPPLPVLPPLPLPPRPLAVAPPPLPVAAGKAASGDSLEMRIGSVWLVRAGVLMLLTFVIFLGTYLYQNIVPHLGPGGKVGLLYLLAGGITGFGAWLERRNRHAGEGDGLLNYARYILAGGLAAVYYVTYAAHFYPGLQVIQSPLVGGALLLGWTAFMAWLADRRDSQLLATFSLLLAFYASATNEVAGFTLYANLVLTAAAVFLLSRRRWTAFSFTALAATFGSYAYWRYGGWLFAGDGAATVPAHGGPWIETAFLACYWLVFTAAAFLDPRGALDVPANKATFVTLNNGALFALGGWLLYPHYADVFWRWPTGFGLVLLGLGDLGRRVPRPLDKATIGAYGLTGIGLVTVGLMMYFVGWRLSLVLAVESAVVLAAASQRNSQPLLWAASIVAGLSFFNALSELTGSLATTGRADGKLSDDSSGYQAWLTGLGGGAIMVFNSWQSQLWRKRTAAPASNWAAPDYFALLGLALWLVLLEEKLSDGGQLAVVLAAAAVGVTALGTLGRLPALVRAAHLYLWAAYWHWVSAGYGSFPAWWKTLILVGVTVALEHWQSLQRRRNAPPNQTAAMLPPWPQLALMTVAVLCAWVWISDRLGRHGEGTFTLAAGWSIYAAAVFALGLALRERVYRWAGLLILGCTLGRIALYDIWQLDMLGRSLSAFMLGAVLLAIGFFYNRFQEKLRAWF